MAKTQAQRDLKACAFQPLPLGTIVPRGWLRRQLRIQADGLSGHLDEFWPDVKDSGWIGGEAEGWERAPYWLDGLIPLAILSDEDPLKRKACRWMDYILLHQGEDGWLGPVKGRRWNGRVHRPYDPWPVFVLLKALTQYQEATGDERAVPAIHKFLSHLNRRLDKEPLVEWARYRWQDLMVSVYWLYDRWPEPWLLDLAAKVHDQGFDWRNHFAEFNYREKLRADECKMDTHVVNNAMGLKASGVWYRMSQDPGDRTAVFQMIETLDRYHGQATGLFAGDEHYAGKNPSQGTELCAVNEYLFSLEVLVSVLGDVELADRLERIVFNALPATFSPDMWAHQYVQQANQVICKVSDDRIYTNNGPEANIFGLEPNFGCCTANMHQGWPKFASHLWMRTPDGGLAAITYAPCEIAASVDRTPVRIQVETEYPFRETVRISVHPGKPSAFPIRLRIPAWAEGAEATIDDGETVSCAPGSFCRIAREWHKRLSVTLRFPMKPIVERRFNRSATVHRGPLVFSLRIDEEWKQFRGDPPHGDWEVYPSSPWNYALQLSDGKLTESIAFEEAPIGEYPLSPEGAPVRARAMGRRVPDWKIERNAAAPPPQSPLKSDEPLEGLILIPYGCTNLRVTEFPVLAED